MEAARRAEAAGRGVAVALKWFSITKTANSLSQSDDAARGLDWGGALAARRPKLLRGEACGIRESLPPELLDPSQFTVNYLALGDAYIAASTRAERGQLRASMEPRCGACKLQLKHEFRGREGAIGCCVYYPVPGCSRYRYSQRAATHACWAARSEVSCCGLAGQVRSTRAADCASDRTRDRSSSLHTQGSQSAIAGHAPARHIRARPFKPRPLPLPLVIRRCPSLARAVSPPPPASLRCASVAVDQLPAIGPRVPLVSPSCPGWALATVGECSRRH